MILTLLEKDIIVVTKWALITIGAIEALRIKVTFFSQCLCIKVPFSEVAPCPFEILARTLDVNHVCGLLKANGLQQYTQMFLGTLIL